MMRAMRRAMRRARRLRSRLVISFVISAKGLQLLLPIAQLATSFAVVSSPLVRAVFVIVVATASIVPFEVVAKASQGEVLSRSCYLTLPDFFLLRGAVTLVGNTFLVRFELVLTTGSEVRMALVWPVLVVVAPALPVTSEGVSCSAHGQAQARGKSLCSRQARQLFSSISGAVWHHRLRCR